MVSVIVPVYNCERSLKRCVDSLLAQSLSDIRIILIDDGSTDKSGELCDRFSEADERILTFHKRNGGVSTARNFGLSKAEGEYVTFVDSDDALHPDHLKNLLELIEQYQSEVAICSFASEIEGSPCKLNDTDELRNEVYVYDHDSAVCELFAGGAVGGYVWNKLYRRSLLESAEFEGGIKILEDLLFNYHVFERVEKAVFTTARSYRYIQNPQSAMHKQFGEQHRSMVEVAERICSEVEGKSPETEAAAKGLLATTIIWVCDVMAENGPYERQLYKQYRKKFKPLKKNYLKLKRVPLSYRMSGIFFGMGYGIFKLSVKTARWIQNVLLKGERL